MDKKVIAIILAILLPPVGVFVKKGKVTNELWISLALSFLFYIPGIAYALWVVTR